MVDRQRHNDGVHDRNAVPLRRASFDPYDSAYMAGHATGLVQRGVDSPMVFWRKKLAIAPQKPLVHFRRTVLVAHRPPSHGWPRRMAFLLALALLSVPLLGFATMFGPDSRLYTDGPVVEGVRMLLLSSPFGFAGALLLRRLITPRPA